MTDHKSLVQQIDEMVAIVAKPLLKPTTSEWNLPIHYGSGAFGSAMDDEDGCDCGCVDDSQCGPQCSCGGKHVDEAEVDADGRYVFDEPGGKEEPEEDPEDEDDLEEAADVVNLAMEKVKRAVEKAPTSRSGMKIIEGAIEDTLIKELKPLGVVEVDVSLTRSGNPNGMGGVAYVTKKEDVKRVMGRLKKLGFTQLKNEGYEEDENAFVLQFDMLDFPD